jgi:hypothetical protein
MIRTLKIHNVNDLLNAAYAVSKKFGGQHVWWRGQARLDWNVIPQLYFRGMHTNEHNLTLLFLNKAKVRHSQCPETEDWAAWLLLMQHYGMPTRLLNWSESVLVAAYFAVCEKKYMDQPGSLWGLEPTKLNELQIERRGLMVYQDDEVVHLFGEAFQNFGSPEQKDDKTLAILTDQLDVRHIVQGSTFTIHGSPTPINQLPNAEKFLVQYEIPPPVKVELLQSLNLLGIKKSFLFPDLEHLANDLVSIQFD